MAMTDIALSLLLLAGIALTIGSFYLYRKGENRQKALLMFVAALVMFANLAIWLIPTPEGATLVSEQAKQTSTDTEASK